MTEPELSWIQRAADSAITDCRRAGGRGIVRVSGVSPSGPIHLGNLREVMTAHFVAEEIKSRGIEAIQLHSWGDYDRFRKVAAGLDESLAEHVSPREKVLRKFIEVFLLPSRAAFGCRDLSA